MELGEIIQRALAKVPFEQLGFRLARGTIERECGELILHAVGPGQARVGGNQARTPGPLS